MCGITFDSIMSRMSSSHGCRECCGECGNIRMSRAAAEPSRQTGINSGKEEAMKTVDFAEDSKVDVLPAGAFGGGDSVEPGSFHGGDTVESGTFHS